MILGLVNRAGAMFLSATFQEAGLAAVKDLAWPLGTERGRIDRTGAKGLGCPIGLAANAKALVGTSRGCGTPTTITYHNVVLAPQFDLRVLRGSTLKSIGFVLLALPVIVGTPPDDEIRLYTAVPNTVI